MARDVALPHVLAILEPIWETKTETASRLRGRIESVLDWATAHGYRQGLNPVRWKSHLDRLLPAPSKITKAGHHAALPVGEVGAFVQALRTQEGTGARALEFAILTAARSGEVRDATWAEIDLGTAARVCQPCRTAFARCSATERPSVLPTPATWPKWRWHTR